MNDIKKRLNQTNGQPDRPTTVIELQKDDNFFAISATAKLSVENVDNRKSIRKFIVVKK